MLKAVLGVERPKTTRRDTTLKRRRPFNSFEADRCRLAFVEKVDTFGAEVDEREACPVCLERLRGVLSNAALRAVSTRDLATLAEWGHGRAPGSHDEPFVVD